MSNARHGRDEEQETVEGLRAQVEQLTAALTAALAGRDRMSMTADGTGPLPAVQRQPASHRVPKEQRWLRVVPGFVPVLGALKYAWHAHRVATAITGTALTAVTATTAVVAVAPHGTVAQVLGAAPAPPAPAASIWDADPITSVSPAALTKPRMAVRRARPIVTYVPVDGPPSLPPPSSAPSASPAQPQPAPPPLLTVPSSPVNLGVYLSTQITIGNPGQQSVSWSVSCGPDVSVSPAMGVLEPGQQDVQLQVQLNPVDGLSGALCTFEPGGEKVTVTWAGAGAPSAGL